MRHLLQESDLAHQRRKVRRLQASVLAVSLTGLLAFILLCVLTRTGNASLMLKLGWICLILSGWSAIALSVCGLKPAKARLTHWEGLLRGEPVLREGVFRMTEERFRIPRSVAARRVLLRSGDEELRLNLDEDWVSLAPPDGSSVRLLTVRKFVTGTEILQAPSETAGAPVSAARRGKGIRPLLSDLIPLWILWAMIAVLLGGFVFNQITETTEDRKITIFADAELQNAPALAEELEKALQPPVRMVKIHPFSYAMFNGDALRRADLYIVPDSKTDEYREWFAPLPPELRELEDPLEPGGIRVRDPESGLAVRGDVILYDASLMKPEVYRLFFGKESLHLTEEDRNAVRAVQELLSDSSFAQEKEEKSSLRVRKVENLPEDFIFGMDVSSVIAEENSGVRYRDFDGEEKDLFRILAENGINAIRVRVWNHPYDEEGRGFGGGNCDIANAVEIGKRAAACGLELLVDFHYSDFWADPGKQMVPRAWENLGIEEKTQAVYDFTLDCLTRLKEAGVPVRVVQTGNETNGKLCGEQSWENIARLMDAGARAVREVYPEALVAVHFSNPEKAGSYRAYARTLDEYEKNGLIRYDVFATSYYPYWHGSLENLSSVLTEIADTYGKRVMVMETSYAWTEEDSDFFGNTVGRGGKMTRNYPFTVQGQADSVRDLTDTVVNGTPAGIGVVYWEGAWITVGQNSREENRLLWERYGSGWATSFAAVYDPDDAGKYYGGNAVDNQAFFDPEGRALESLKVFRLMREGNEKN